MTRIRTISLAILALGITCGFSYALLFTATGLSWYLNLNLADSQGNISINNVNHSINGLYTISDFRYQSNTLNIKVDHLQIDWNPLSLMDNELDIQELIGTNVSVDVKTPTHLLIETNRLTFPVATKLARGSIKDFSMTSKDGSHRSYDKIEFEQLFLDQEFFAEKITATDRAGTQLTIAGRFGFQSNSVINLTTSALITLPVNQQALYSHGTLVGNTGQLRFLQKINAPFTTTVTGLIKNPLLEPYWELTADINTSNGIAISTGTRLHKLSGNISASGSIHDYKLSGELFAEDKYSRQWSASLSSDISQLLANFQLTAHQPNATPTSQTSIEGTLQLDKLMDFSRAINIKGNWNNFTLLLDNESEIKSKKGDFTYSGDTLEAVINASGLKIANTGTDFKELQFKSSLDTDHRIIIEGKASTANGKVHLSGNLAKASDQYQIENLTIHGNNFALVKKPQAHIIISPDMSFVRHGKTIVSNGVIKIPTANIQLQELTSTIGKLTALSETLLAGDKSPNKIIGGTFNIELGKAVWLHGYGLNANVTGDLAIAKLSGQGIIADGVLNVLRGNYYNQDKKLAVAGGQLKFSRNNLDNPELDLNLTPRTKNLSNLDTIKGRLQSLFTQSQQRSVNTNIQPVNNQKQLALNKKL